MTIVTDAGSHGTHVAGIVAANFEGEPSRNGVAPGAQVRGSLHLAGDPTAMKAPAIRPTRLLGLHLALDGRYHAIPPATAACTHASCPLSQILACKIGDGRLGSAETGTGLVRALIAAKAAGCDLINLSYGEPYWQADKGRVAQTFTDAVHKWGMTVFTSAGNDGPALSTLGSPGCLSAPITVGAFVSSQVLARTARMPRVRPSLPLACAVHGTQWHAARRSELRPVCLRR